MWTTVALMSALSFTPAQAGQLELKNARFTYGFLGQARKESTFLPGDLVLLQLDIEGLKVKDDGYAKYSVGWSLFSHKKNKELFAKEAQPLEVVNSLGGSSQPVFIMPPPQTYMDPGDYTIKVEVADIQGGAKQKLERKFTVKPLEFGIVNPGFVYNVNPGVAGPLYAPPVAVPLQNLMLHFTTVGATEGGAEKNLPKVTLKVEIQDESGNPVKKTPITGKAERYDTDEARKLKLIPFQIPIQVNRSGKFKVVVSAKDEHAGKTASLPPLDLTVIDVK